MSEEAALNVPIGTAGDGAMPQTAATLDRAVQAGRIPKPQVVSGRRLGARTPSRPLDRG